MKDENKNSISRRTFLRYAGSLAAFAGASAVLPGYALAGFGQGTRDVLTPRGPNNIIDLTIGRMPKDIDGKTGKAIGINGSVPGPLVRMQEGQNVLIRVKNELDEDTSIHWHGILPPFQMDGVPGVSFDGIKPGTTFEYRYTLNQNGTYWYHSHSKLQEQFGHYGPLIVDPAGQDPVQYDREYPVVLSDFTFEDPYEVLENLVKMEGYYNYQRRDVGEFMNDVKKKGFGNTAKDYLAWGRMRMSATDLLDVTGAAYTYLMNGHGPASNWNALFKPGEKVRLRFINASAGTTAFDVRIPGMKMTVVHVDGQDVEPVPIDEFRIGIAETYDVIVEPKENQPYTIFAESLDRSGYARGTLAPREGMKAAVPKLRPRPQRSHKDMGMNMAAMDMDGMDMEGDGMKMKEMDHDKMDHGNMNHGDMKMPAMKETPVKHGPQKHGPGAATVAQNQFNRLDEPGIGLGNDGRKVLVYNDLKRLEPNTDKRPPAREVELHLTGNMERYMWSFDGDQFHEVDGPIEFTHNERLRLTLVNDTMMEHPIHLHGMWMELENDNGDYNPRKHTLLVQPAQRISALITPRDKGRWAFHCHILYHLERGMFRVVQVADENGSIYETGENYG
jgi:CopA family copper-resistance protein